MYSEVTSAVTRYTSFGRVGSCAMPCNRCLVPLRKEGWTPATGFRTEVRYFDNLSVGPSQPLIIGRGGLPGLWIFGRK